eukprot:COSAG02_NODE_10850_length_1846_cov_1.447624_2_plen_127_part_00
MTGADATTTRRALLGKLTNKDKSAYYEGNWKNDKRHGFGRMTHSNGDVYEGDWENGKQCGTGKVEMASKDVYEVALRMGRSTAGVYTDLPPVLSTRVTGRRAIIMALGSTSMKVVVWFTRAALRMG